jgi:hypothetical protein
MRISMAWTPPAATRRLEAAGVSLLGLRRFVRPIIGNQGRRFGPGNFHERILKPVISQVSMLGDDDLETRRILLGKAQKEFEQSPNRLQIRILFGSFDRSGGLGIDRLRREIDLGGLID